VTIRVPLLPAWLRWGVVVAVGGFILYTSVLTVPPETAVDAAKPGALDLIQLDKWRHFVAYAALGGALAYATTDWNLRPWTVGILVIGVTVLYGVGMESWQSFLPDRHFSVDDAYASAVGGTLVTPWYLIDGYFDVDFVRLGEWISGRQ
jgi:VanZ family protein